MAVSKSIAEREEAAASRAIALGWVVSRYLGRDDLPYVLQAESGLWLDQLEELLSVLESGNGEGRVLLNRDVAGDLLDALGAIQALGQVLGLDPAETFDRTAAAAMIEREARRASAIVETEFSRFARTKGPTTRAS